MVNDHLSRTAGQLVASLGWSAAGVWNHKSFPLYGHTLFVIGPEHARTIGAEGWTKQDVKRCLYETVRRRARDLAPGSDGAETGRLRQLVDAGDPEALIPKFPSVDEILVVVAGGTAGRFSAVVPGWMGGEMGSRPVIRAIEG